MRNRNRSHFIRNWLILLAVLGIGGFVIFKTYMSHQLDAVDPNNKTVQAFVIKKGETTPEIVQDLKDKGLIKSTMAFSEYLKQTGADQNIQAGDYKLSPSMDAKTLVENMQRGAEDKWVTLLEGWRNEEIADKLNKELGLDKAAFLKLAKEGHMFPDTYLINKEASPDTVASLLKNTFTSRYDDELQEGVKAKGLTAEQGLILASLVEREARTPEVKKQVASIMLKRLKIGMGLNIDATIQYALGYQTGEKSWWKRSLTYDDLKINSPYNTYINAGLPPTPICNPGLASLKAVAAADSSTPYLYYFHDSQGNTYYARTLEEHNENVANHR